MTAFTLNPLTASTTDDIACETPRWLRVISRSFAVVLFLVGLYLTGGGAWLAFVGGSPAYLAFGIFYLVGVSYFWRCSPVGGWVAGCTFVAVSAWAVNESGYAFWSLFARVMVPAGLAAAGLGIAAILFSRSRRTARLLTWGAAGVPAAVLVAMFAAAFVPHDVVSPPPDAAFRLAKGDNAPSQWSAYGRNTMGTRFAPFDQINRDNVSKLDVAWTFHTGDKGDGVDQNTPLQVGDSLYTCSPNDHVAALDVDTGDPRWRFSSDAKSPIWQRCRSLGYFDGGASAGAPCAKRIFNTTIDARLIALDAATGTPCPEFGNQGTVDLKVGQGEVIPGFYFQTSGPLVAREHVIVGGWVVDNQARGEPSGVIRSFNARSGALEWAWDLGNPSITKLPPPGETYTRGTPNMWTHAAYDDALGLVYIPLGNETPDYYGIGRNPKSNDYNSSLVALDVNTGRERWHVQTVHHDIWDYDLPSQPALVDIPEDGGRVSHAVVQATKRGQLFVLDRATGVPLSKIVEKPVPQSGAVPEERLSPTQPYSVDMPVIGSERFTESDAWGMTILDQLACRIQFKQLRYDGDFTPIGLQWSIEQPGNVGGLNWGSLSVDPANNYAYMVDVRVPLRYKLVLRKDYEAEAASYPKVVDGHGPSPQLGTPYGQITVLWLSPLGVPCVRPPYGTVTAVDLRTKRIAWQVPAGTAEQLGPFGIKSHLPMPIGLPAYAGASATAGGLVFYAGTQDFHIRAFDAQTGKEVWKHELPVGASATPMTYVSRKTGREYVVVSVGGSAHSAETGDYVIAFALPR